ncbi:MAG TPA: rRNA maturation RNase YbeY [Anaerolineales bacterium]
MIDTEDTMITLEIIETYSSQVDASLLEGAAQAVLESQLAAPDTEVTLVVSNDEQLQQLNRQFLGVDAPTDVLSFPAGYTDPETGAPYLGDVLISYPRAEAQAAAAGHPVENELQLLVVHGLLHLLGHDHLEEDEKARMWAAQAEILDRLGVSINSLPE